MAQGCYRPQYLTGSFKGISFKSEEVSSEHGRRGAEGEFPFGENTAYADLGRRIRTYSVSARFDSSDHIAEARALITVCEGKGPGVLVHPTRGVVTSAACRSLRVKDSVEEQQGVTYVEMDFVEANNWSNGITLTANLLGLQLTAIISPARASFLLTYTPTKVPFFRLDAIINNAQFQIGFIALEYFNATPTKSDQLARNRIYSDINRVSMEDDLAKDPATMDKTIALGLQAIASEVSGVDKFNTFRRIANNAAKTSTFTSIASDTENAVYSTTRIISAAYMTQGVLEATGQSTGSVFAQLDAIDAILADEEVFTRQSCNNEMFLAVRDFRITSSAQLLENAYSSPGLVGYNFSGSVHPVAAAYAIYGDAKQHRALEVFNRVGYTGRFAGLVSGERQ